MPCTNVRHLLLLVSLVGCANSGADAANATMSAKLGGAGRLAAAAGIGVAMSGAISAPRPEAAGGGGTAAASAVQDDGTSFETSVQPFIDMACNCHQSDPLMAPFSLKKGEAFKAIVNVPSSQVKTMMLVQPGSTQQSYLWHKVNGSFLDVGGTGMIMPFTLPLTGAEKTVFEKWILAGAKP